MNSPVILILGPLRTAVSGVSTHLNLLFGSTLPQDFRLVQFQVGSAGRSETRLGWLARLVASPFQLAAALLRNDVDILHVNTSLDARAYWRDLVYVLVAKLCGARVLYQVHGGHVRVFCGRWRRLERFMRRVMSATLKWPDVVVVISRSELQAMRELAPQQRIELLPNGTDCTPLLERARPPADPRAPLRLVYIGRLVRTKGLFESLAAIRLVRDRGADVRFSIAGSGPEEPALREAVRSLGLDDVVHFAGPTFGERKLQLLAEADVLMLPTYHLEGLPYALLEGMAAGLVPIVTHVGAIPDVVQPEVHALFVPPRDPQTLSLAIERLAADRALLARMGAASRQRVATSYSLERVAGDFANLYRVLIGPWIAPKAS